MMYEDNEHLRQSYNVIINTAVIFVLVLWAVFYLLYKQGEISEDNLSFYFSTFSSLLFSMKSYFDLKTGIVSITGGDIYKDKMPKLYAFNIVIQLLMAVVCGVGIVYYF